jgi:DNA-binding NtrC family response regulator
MALGHESFNPELVVLIFSAYGDFEKAQVAIREHVYHYLLKACQSAWNLSPVMKACLEGWRSVVVSGGKRRRWRVK